MTAQQGWLFIAAICLSQLSTVATRLWERNPESERLTNGAVFFATVVSMLAVFSLIRAVWG